MCVLIIGLLLASCPNPIRETIVAVVSRASTATWEANHGDGAPIGPITALVFSFSETIDTSSVELGGTLGQEATAQWSSTDAKDDTLTVTPRTEWPAGSNQTLTVSCVDLQTYPASPVHLTYGVLDNIVHVHGDRGNDDNPGTPDLPTATIRRAVQIAESLFASADVRIAEGTYEENLSISGRIRLRGGFSADDWSLFETDPRWSLAGSRTSAYPTVIASVHLAGLFDSFTPAAVGLTPNADVGLSFLTIREEEDFYNDQTTSAAIFVDGSTLRIESCAVYGGRSDYPYGVSIDGGSLTIQDSFVHAGDLVPDQTALGSVDSSVEIVGSHLECGDSDLSHGSATGIFAHASELNIAESTIRGGWQAGQSEAIVCIAGTVLTVQNTQIDAGNTRVSFGIAKGIRSESSTITVRNATIRGGHSPSDPTSAVAITLDDATTATVENTIIFMGDVDTGSLTTGIRCATSAPPAALRNNTIFGCDVLVREAGSVSTNITDAATLNDRPYASGNITETALLVNQAVLDWSLAPGTPVNIRQGGLDGSAEGWGFATDLAGTPRTNLAAGPDSGPANSGAAGWSMGAYESDD